MSEHPDANAAAPKGPPDTLMDAGDAEALSRLDPEQLRLIDSALLAACAPSWRKVARVVGQAMGKLESEFPDLSDSAYALRVIALVAEDRLASQGDWNHMRFSEVRLPS